MDLIARRRALMMGQASKGNTPIIAMYGYYLNRSATGTTANEAWCYTDWYDVDPVSETTIYICDNNTDGSHTFQYTTSGGSSDYWYGPRRGIAKRTNKIRFSIQIANLDTCYAYNETTGQIFFAGKNSIYFGYDNINDMPT